jgi:hypothetical protein
MKNLIGIARPWLRALTCLLPASLMLATGCLSGGGKTLIAISPNTTQTLDAGQTLTLTASVVNDQFQFGGTFSLSGPGTLVGVSNTPGTGEVSYVTAVYTAPASLIASTTATITATSQNTPSSTSSVTIILNPALSITTTTLPSGTVASPYSAPVLTTGGTTPLKWSLASGSLPSGITLNSATGVLSGTPTAYGNFPISIAVTDSASTPVTVTQSYSLVINPQAPVVTPATLAKGTAGSTYSQQLSYTGGGAGTVTWTQTAGALPTGITLSSSGLLSGTPANSTAGNTYTFSVTVSVGTQTSAPVQFSITIYPLPVVTTTTLPNGNVGAAYSQQLSYSGGNGGAVSWAIVAGSLPTSSGLTLSSSGLISGNPTAATTYSFSVAVTVGPQTSAAQPLTLAVNNMVVTSSPNAAGEVNLPFSFHLTAQGGTGPYTWSLAAGSAALPSPLTLDGATGLITGAPTTNAGSPFTGIIVQAKDTLGATATLAMTFTINAAASTVNNAVLKGSYPFLLSGFDAARRPLVTGGVFVANGSGAITGGVIDSNGTGLSAAVTNTAITGGSYSVGADNRGRLVLTTSSGTSTYVLALNSGATGGYLTEFDLSGQSLTGTFALQTSTGALTSGYAFGAGGFAANSTAGALTHRALIGELQCNSGGGFASAEYLSSGAISASPTVPTTGSVNIGGFGRGSISFTKPGGAGTLNFIVYEVSGGQLYLLSSDPASGNTGTNDLVSGTALKQTISNGNFNAASLSGTSVVRSESLQTPTTGAQYADVVVGLYNFSGAGAVTLSADENAGGTAKSKSLTGTYTVAANGRVAATLSSGLSGCLNCIAPNETFFYLVGANLGFSMDFTPEAFSGSFEPQTATGISNGSFSGTYATGSLSPLSASATLLSGVLNSGGAGSVTGTEDTNTVGTLAPNAALSATYVVAASGRATFVPSGGNNSVLYIVSTTKAILLDITTASPAINEIQH